MARTSLAPRRSLSPTTIPKWVEAGETPPRTWISRRSSSSGRLRRHDQQAATPHEDAPPSPPPHHDANGSGQKESKSKKVLSPKSFLIALCVTLVIHMILVAAMLVVAMKYQDYLESVGTSDRTDRIDDVELSNLNSRSWTSDQVSEGREVDRDSYHYLGADNWVMDPVNSYRYRVFNCIIILFIPPLVTAIAIVEESFVAQIWALIFQVVSLIFSIVVITKDLYQVSTGLIVVQVLFYLNWIILILLSIIVLKNNWPKSGKKVTTKVVGDEDFPDDGNL